MKQTLKRRKCDHSETEETSSNIHANVSSKENTDEDDKTTKTDAILDNNNRDGLINGEKGLNACRSETEAVLDVIPNEAEEVSESVVITHNENGGGDDLDSSPSGEKNICTPEGSVNDVIEGNHDRLNKGKKRVNTLSSERECIQALIPNDCDKASKCVVNYCEENTGGDSFDISPNGEKKICTPENDSVLDANEGNRDGLNKGEKE